MLKLVARYPFYLIARAVDCKGKTGIIANGGILNCEMMEVAGYGWPPGSDLETRVGC